MSAAPSSLSRFRGSLLGLALGDGLGARFEGHSREGIRRRFPTLEDMFSLEVRPRAVPAGSPPGIRPESLQQLQEPESAALMTTDDTEMMLGVAETLLEVSAPSAADFAERYVRNYTPWRGYGRGAHVVLQVLGDGMPVEEAATIYFADGSYGNGAAMRVAPVGLLHHADAEAVTAQARASALPTHCHPVGVEGAVFLAHAVRLAYASAGSPFDKAAFFAELEGCLSREELLERLARAKGVGPDELIDLGNGIAAHESAVTAAACFALFPDDYREAVGAALYLGGDADTIAAMAGACSGARLGEEALPEQSLAGLELARRDRVAELAERLHARVDWTDV